MNRKGNWMQTYSGLAYWPEDPLSDEVRIVDIAHHLSMICRYTGACSEFYSVAEHSVLVSNLVAPEHALTGLMHDAPEAYLNDMSSPVKHSANMVGYRALEKLNWLCIADKYDLPLELPEEVKRADGYALFHEQAELLKPSPRDDWGMGLQRPEIVMPYLIGKWSPAKAERVFLDRFLELM